MKKRNLICLGLFLSLQAFTQIPRTISYQGVLTDNQGTLFPDGNNTLTLNLYEFQNGGIPIYKETQTVPVVRGVFNVIIGTVTPLPQSIGFDRAYFLGVAINNGQELTPRTALTASPYAFRSGKADLADDLTNGAVYQLNGLKGNITLEGAGSTTVNQQGSIITISSTGGSGGNGIQGVQNSDGTLIIQNPNGPAATINLATEKITTDHIKNATIQAVDIAPGVIPNVSNFMQIGSNAGGDLTGTYPNPTINSNTINTNKIVDGTIQAIDIAAGVIPNVNNFMQIGSNAGGDLTGTYPNPTINSNTINTNKIVDGTIQAVDIAAGVIPNVNNFIQIGSNAGGDLTGTYPNPTINSNSINTNKIVDGTIQAVDIAAGVIPSSLPPNGAAGGDLSGSYPNPTIGTNKITTNHILNETILPIDLNKTGATHNDALIFDVQGGNSNWVLRKPAQVLQGNGIQVSASPTGPLTYTVSAIDQNATNEIQSLTFNSSNKQLTISSANTVDLSSLNTPNHWTLTGNNISNNNSGNVGIGTTTPVEKLEVNGEALITGGNQTGFANASLRVLPTNANDITALYAKGTGSLGNGIESVGKIGVLGITSATNGAGIYGTSSGKSPGVIGIAMSDIGISGTGTTGVSGSGNIGLQGVGIIGVYGKSTDTGGGSRAIAAEGGAITIEALQNSPGIGTAIQGTSVNGLGDGIVGISNGTGNGVQGVNSTTTGTSGWAGLFGGRVKITNTLTMVNNIIPIATNTVDLGTSTLRWKKIFLNNAPDFPSDRRLKKNIKPIDYGLSEILSLNPVRYVLKEDDNTDEQFGLIAQDVKSIIPEIVKGNEEKEMLSLSYMELIPVLINAVKELNGKVNILSIENQNLKTSLENQLVLSKTRLDVNANTSK